MTKELRAALKDILAGEIETLPERLATMGPIKRTELLIKLLPYAMPKVDSAPWHVGETSDLDDLLDC